MLNARGQFVFLKLAKGAFSLTDPACLQTLIPSATRITIAEGEKKTLDLRAGGAV